VSSRTTGVTSGSASRAAFLCALGACTFTLLALRMPIASEVRYIEAAREMVEGGDWVVPHLGHVPYFEKPILLYWLSAASQLALGGSFVAARLPSILAAALSLLVTWDVARRLLGERGGMQAALLTLGSGYFLALGSVLTTDTLFAACLWSAWYCWWRAREERASTWKWLYCVATALGFMTKGPLALILVGGSIATFLVFREPPATIARRIGRGLRAALVQGHVLRLALVTVALNLPWTLLVLRRDPRFLEFFYVRENFQAFFHGQVHHTQPPYYYAGVLLYLFAPWSLPCIFGLAVALRERIVAAWRPAPASRGTELRAYLGAIALFTLVFLQASSAKLASYPLPILPALAILIVDCWRARLPAPPAWLRWSLLVNALVTLAGGAYLLYGRRAAADSLPDELRLHLSTVLALGALTTVAGGILALRGRFWAGIAASGVALFVVVAIGSARLEELAHGSNVHPLAQRIAELERPGDLVLTTSQFAQDYTLQLRLHRRIGLVGRARELGMGFFAEVTPPGVPIPDDPYGVSAETLPSNPWLFTHAQLVAELRSERRVWYVASHKEVDQLRAEGLRLRAIDTAGDACLVTNVP